jgi:hypothetical protein
MKLKTVSGALCIALLFTATAQAQDLVSYPMRAHDFIHPNKWSAFEAGSILDAHRRVTGDVLSLAATSPNGGEYGIAMVEPNATMFAARFTVHKATIGGCTPFNKIRALLTMTAFNANGWGTAGDATGDVRALIALERDCYQEQPYGALVPTFYIVSCPDAACNWTTPHQSGDFGFGVTVPVDTPVTLQINWEPATRRFSFKRDTGAAIYLPYTLSHGYTPGVPQERISINAVTPQGPGINAKMELLVHDVQVSNRRLLTDKASYAYGEPVYVSYSGMPEWDYSYVGIERAGVSGYHQWRGTSYNSAYAPSTGTGSAYFPNPSSDGTYVARFFDSTGAVLMESAPFTVAAPTGTATISTNKFVYALGEDITVNFANGFNYWDLITLAIPGSTPDSYVSYNYSNAGFGYVTRSVPLPHSVTADNYVVRMVNSISGGVVRAETPIYVGSVSNLASGVTAVTGSTPAAGWGLPYGNDGTPSAYQPVDPTHAYWRIDLGAVRNIKYVEVNAEFSLYSGSNAQVICYSLDGVTWQYANWSGFVHGVEIVKQVPIFAQARYIQVSSLGYSMYKLYEARVFGN